MKEFFIGLGMGTVAGLAVGMIAVAKNKKLSNKINEGLDKAEEKFEDAKEAISKKLNSCKCDEKSQKTETSNPDSKVCC